MRARIRHRAAAEGAVENELDVLGFEFIGAGHRAETHVKNRRDRLASDPGDLVVELCLDHEWFPRSPPWRNSLRHCAHREREPQGWARIVYRLKTKEGTGVVSDGPGEPVGFQPCLFCREGLATLVERTEHWSRDRGQVGEPATFRVRFDVAGTGDARPEMFRYP